MILDEQTTLRLADKLVSNNEEERAEAEQILREMNRDTKDILYRAAKLADFRSGSTGVGLQSISKIGLFVPIL